MQAFGSYFLCYTGSRYLYDIKAKNPRRRVYNYSIPFPAEDLGDYVNEQHAREFLQAYRNMLALMWHLQRSMTRKQDPHVFLRKYVTGDQIKYVDHQIYWNLQDLGNRMCALCLFKFATRYRDYFDIWWKEPDIFPIDIYSYLESYCSNKRDRWEPYYATALLAGLDKLDASHKAYRNDFPLSEISVQYTEP